MKNKVFYRNKGPHSLAMISQCLNIEMDPAFAAIKIKDVKPLTAAVTGDISFLSNKKYLNDFKATKASACIVPADFNTERQDVVLLRSNNPYYACALVTDLFYEYNKDFTPQIKPSAQIADKVKIGENCYIGHNVVIESGVEIGSGSIIEAGSFIDQQVVIGKNAQINANVSIAHAIIGDNVRILSGACIGQDGFGFATNQGVHKKIYHIGRVIIGNDVEIGANSCIDRGSVHDTIIEDLCRIDNLVQIGHNAHIKRGTILVAQVGIAGSSTVGQYCALGGQVGVAGHITIADQVQIAGQGGVIQDITTPGALMGGTPAVPVRQWHRQNIMLKKLAENRNR